MKKIISCFIVFMVWGCESQQYTDPYVLKMDGYKGILENWNYQSSEKPAAPEKPTYLFCGPATIRGRMYGGYTTSGYTMSRCMEINDERREAYNSALKQYQAAIARVEAPQAKQQP